MNPLIRRVRVTYRNAKNQLQTIPDGVGTIIGTQVTMMVPGTPLPSVVHIPLSNVVSLVIRDDQTGTFADATLGEIQQG